MRSAPVHREAARQGYKERGRERDALLGLENRHCEASRSFKGGGVKSESVIVLEFTHPAMQKRLTGISCLVVEGLRVTK